MSHPQAHQDQNKQIMAKKYTLKPTGTSSDFKIDYANELNPQQFEAATAPSGPSLVIAGAGAGKTRTLTYRVAYLIESGIRPDRILLLTFTNKASREMIDRVASLMQMPKPGFWGGTFHSIGHKILRTHAVEAGFTPEFSIMDREDARDFLKSCIAKLDIDAQSSRFPKPDLLINLFSLQINLAQPLDKLIQEKYDQFTNLTAEITELFSIYTLKKREANCMDFDDLLILWLKLLKNNPDILLSYQDKFQAILVDEYQDTNFVQGEIVDTLAQKHKNVMVVGDDSQSIYGWRGANFENILSFPNRFPGTRIYKIETNYRSTPEILSYANAAIAPNIHQYKKSLQPVREHGMKPVLVTTGNSSEQAQFVAQRILEVRDEGIELEEMAVLYRSHFHCLELQMELTSRNIPFVITSGIRFFEQAHIKDVVALLKILCNPRDEISFKRVTMLLPGLGIKTSEKIWIHFETLLNQSPAQRSDVPSRLAQLSPSIPKKSLEAWTQLVYTTEQMLQGDIAQQPSRQIHLILDAFYREYAQKLFENSQHRLDELNELANFAAQFDSVENFLGQLALLTELESENSDLSRRNDDDEKIRLSTVHQAKGLEFKVVFVIMMAEGLFPNYRASESAEGREEERRLFYVAITRAKDQVYLTWPKYRETSGYGNPWQKPASFLLDVPENLYDEWELD